MNKTTSWSLLASLCILAPIMSAHAFEANSDPSLVGWWKLDDGAGTTAVDSSPGKHNGTLTNGPVWTTGHFGGGLQFDGVDDYVDTGWTTNLPKWTLACWVTSPAAPASAGVMPSGPVHRENNYQINWNHNNGGEWPGSVASNIGGTWTAASLGPLQANTWYFLCGTYDGTNLKAYTNGVLVTTKNVPGTPNNESNSFKFGRHAANAQYFQGTVDDVRVYDRALEVGEIQSVMKGAEGPATAPKPADEATDVARDVILSWKPGPFAGTHNVYFGTSLADVNAATTTASPLCVSTGQDANTYVPPALLGWGTTYYWRVDEVNATPDHFPYPGEIWSFTTEPIGYPIDVNSITATASSSYTGFTPRSTIDKSGLTGDVHGTTTSTMWTSAKNPAKPVSLRYDFDKAYKLYQMLVWNYNGENEIDLGYGLQDVAVEYSSDGTTWAKLGDFVFNQATAREDYQYNTVIDFGGLTVKSVKLLATSNYGGGRYGLSELRFLYIPVWARQPKPDVNSTGVDPRGTNLTWRSGREAVSHDVYLGTDPNALTLSRTVNTNAASVGTLNLGTKYYWRVDEVNNAATPKSWTGDVWYFTTPNFLAVDDFEAYNDSEGTAVFNAWTDGYGTADNGGQIGYDVPGPYMEKTIRHGGNQSTPFYYKNVGTPAKNFSEATRTFDTAQDWTVAKADTLRIWVRGRTADIPTGSLPAATTAFNISSAGSDIYQATDQFRFIYRQLTGDGTITAKVESQQPTNQYAKAGVMIRVGLDVGALETHMVTMPGAGNTTTTPRQVEWNFRPTVGDATGRTLATTPATTSTWLRLTRKGDVITGEYSADGITWSSAGLTTTPQTIPMGNPVNIGLIVCSHVTTTLGEAKFSNVKVTGNVTGEWQKADIGITAQPAGNTADTFYVTVADNAGKTKTVIPTTASPVCTTGSWQAVDIPFSQFTGVSMTSVKSLTFGVGDKTGAAPQHGAGLLYIDDIGVGHPAQ